MEESKRDKAPEEAAPDGKALGGKAPEEALPDKALPDEALEEAAGGSKNSLTGKKWEKRPVTGLQSYIDDFDY